MSNRGFYFDLLDELDNSANIHKEIVKRIEKSMGRNIICYVANPNHPGGAIQDGDAEIIESLLRGMELKEYEEKFDLIIDSPGGLPYSAEKVVKVCRTYSKSFRTIVLSHAMSAATLLCLGSEEILMGETSKLGPIDPQMIYPTKEGAVLRSSKSFIDAFREMVGACQQAIIDNRPPDPYLHILDTMDVSWVIECIRARQSTEVIAKTLLENGMFKNEPTKVDGIVKKLIELGEETHHIRPLYYEDAQKIGLKVQKIDKELDIWKDIWELYLRMQIYANKKGLAKYICNRDGGIEHRVVLKPL